MMVISFRNDAYTSFFQLSDTFSLLIRLDLITYSIAYFLCPDEEITMPFKIILCCKKLFGILIPIKLSILKLETLYFLSKKSLCYHYYFQI